MSVTETTAALAARWKRAFEAAHPRVTIALGRPGPPLASGNPDLAAFLRGGGDLAIVSRELSETDAARFRARAGAPPRATPVARGPWNDFGYLDPVVFVVNDANPLRAIAVDRLEALLAIDPSRRPADWAALGIAGWSGRPVRVVGGVGWARGETSARGQVVRERLLGGRPLPADLPPDSGDEAQVPELVARDPAAIGFTGGGHLRPGEHALALVAGGRAVAPDCVAVATGRYPLARTVNLYADPVRAADRWVARFRRFVLSRRGQALVAAARPWLPLAGGAATCDPATAPTAVRQLGFRMAS